MTEIRPLYSQPFTNSHFHFPIILESVTCQILLQWSELHYNVQSVSSEMMHRLHHLSTAYFHHERTVKLVGRWTNASVCFGDMMQKDYIRWNKLLAMEVLMTYHCCYETKKPYLLYIPCRFQNPINAVLQILSNNQETIQNSH